jgi:hypothetical protein
LELLRFISVLILALLTCKWINIVEVDDHNVESGGCFHLNYLKIKEKDMPYISLQYIQNHPQRLGPSGMQMAVPLTVLFTMMLLVWRAFG